MPTLPVALLSCGKRQCVAILRHLSRQVEEGFAKGVDRKGQRDYLAACVGVLVGHEVPGVRTLAMRLQGTLPIGSESLETWSAILAAAENEEPEGDGFCVTNTDRAEVRAVGARGISLVLDNLRSVFNVGCLLRTAETLGAGTVYLCGHTPTPDNPKMAKSALGSERWVRWEYFANALDCLHSLRRRNVALYALETSVRAADINSFVPRLPCALVLGNERFGLGEPVLARADRILALPLYGRKNSLNVAVCGSMALGALMRAQ